MRYFNQKFLFAMSFLFFLSACNAEKAKDIQSSELVSKKYFVKGMTCGGCVFGVKAALGKAESLNIAGKDISAGEAVLQFDKKSYKENSTDCEVSKIIEKFTEFKVYLNKDHTKKACKS